MRWLRTGMLWIGLSLFAAASGDEARRA